MAKRSDFPRRVADAYQTWDTRAVLPLLRHLPKGTRFIEPCVGEGRLRDHLEAAGHTCDEAHDSEVDATKTDYLTGKLARKADCFITNPPWTRDLLHPIIVNLSNQLPTWLLFDAGWMHTLQARPYLERLYTIVSVGRVRWIEGSKMDGKDDCCWYFFTRGGKAGTSARFYGRT